MSASVSWIPHVDVREEAERFPSNSQKASRQGDHLVLKIDNGKTVGLVDCPDRDRTSGRYQLYVHAPEDLDCPAHVEGEPQPELFEDAATDLSTHKGPAPAQRSGQPLHAWNHRP